MSLSNEPKDLRRADNRRRRDPNCWFYEEPYGLQIISAPSPKTRAAVIPVAQIRSYLRRLDAGDTEER